jgi:rhodanese-related sulfurtransferase
VNIAGFAAENILQGLVRTVQWSDLREGRTPADAVLLDVREPDEVSRGRIEGAVNVPLHSLRDRLAELPKGRPIIVYCAAGLRAYLACRILSQSGFAEVYNLSGGYQTYAVASAE